MRYCPVSSVTPVRTFVISAGLDASMVTPGSTAPDVSRTVPARLCADATPAPATRIATAANDRINTRFMWENLHTARVESPRGSVMRRRSVDYERTDRICQALAGVYAIGEDA